MKISANKYKIYIILRSIMFIILEIGFILYYGFKGYLIILVYIVLTSIPIRYTFDLCTNHSIPTVTIDYNSKTVTLDYIVEEMRTNDMLLGIKGDKLHFDEIIKYEVEDNKMMIHSKSKEVRVIYLKFFSKRQIITMKDEMEKIVKQNNILSF